MMSTKSKIKSYLFSWGLATSVLLVGLYPEWFAEYGLVESFIKIVVWLVFLIGFFAIGILGIMSGVLLWFSSELSYETDIEKINVMFEQYKELKPKLWKTLPLTLYWLTAFVLANKATDDWDITGGAYLLFSILTWAVIYGFAKGINSLVVSLKEEHDNSNGMPAELRRLKKY